MAVKSGAGAAVASGANFQARVAGYLIVADLCDFSSPITRGVKVARIGFETAESIDDINIHLEDGSAVYVQAKARIDYSASSESELSSVLKQFESQHASSSNGFGRYLLVVGSKSSRKLRDDLRVALDALRGGTYDAFRRDQPQALVKIIDEQIRILNSIRTATNRPADEQACTEILRRSYVHLLDVEEGETLEQSTLLLLNSKGFTSPEAIWGKIISDCLTHARRRRTVNFSQVESDYRRFQAKAAAVDQKASEELLEVSFRGTTFAAGREVVLTRIEKEIDFGEEKVSGLAIIEFYRFDDDCRERIRFTDESVILSDGSSLPLLRRTSTFEGMNRQIDLEPNLVRNDLTMIPINSDEVYDETTCAKLHRARLDRAFRENKSLLRCLQCGRQISSNDSPIVERGSDDSLQVGLVHLSCLVPSDRVIGSVLNGFFSEYPELINFDAIGWFKAAHGGQVVFDTRRMFGAEGRIIWGGPRPLKDDGPFVVEVLLQSGETEFVTVRLGIQRFWKEHAEKFAATLNSSIKKDRDTDPLCLTDQTKSFGRRSFLLEKFGANERIRHIEHARVQKYQERFAARYQRQGQWYAPLMLLRVQSTGTYFTIMGSVVLLTDPRSLARYRSNWSEAGVELPDFETVSLLTDREFDGFMQDLTEAGGSAVVDPALTVDISTNLVHGIRIVPIEEIVQGLG